MKKFIFLLQACLLLAVSCAQNETVELDGKVMRGISVDEIVAVMPQVDMEGVKSTLSFDGSTLTTAWSNDDQIGFWPKDIYTSSDPEKKVTQSIFYVSEGGTNSAKFKANGWGLLSGATYYSYYPYAASATKDCVAVDFSGQTQNGNNDLSHLALKDVFWGMVEDVKINESTINYNRLATIAKFNLTLPGARISVKSMTLSSDGEALFAENATFNPCSNTQPALSASGEKSKEMTVTLTNVSSDTGNNVVVYAMMCPTAWSGKTINVKVTGTDNSEYVGEFKPSQNQSAGNLYEYSPEPLEANDEIIYDDHRYKILSFGEKYANCYVVSGPGYYCFDATKIGNGTDLPAGNPMLLFVTDNKHYSEAAEAESYFSGLNLAPVSTLVQNRYLCFYISESAFPSNVCYAVKANNDIQWSWHIWCTKGELKTTSAFGKTLLDRNLGALGTSGADRFGLYYQWGKKDPMPALAGNKNKDVDYNSGEGMYFYYPEKEYAFSKGNGYSDCQATVAESIKNPQKSYHSVETKIGHWNSDGKLDLWGSTKTDYDPCPYGYRVMDNEGLDFDKHPSSTSEWVKSGAFGIFGSTTMSNDVYQYWTCEATDNYPGLVGSYVGYCIDGYQIHRPSYCQSGLPVRCQKISQ